MNVRAPDSTQVQYLGQITTPATHNVETSASSVLPIHNDTTRTRISLLERPASASLCSTPRFKMPLLLSEFDASFRYSFFVLANLVIIIWTYKVVVPARVGWTRFVLAFPLFILCYLVFTLFDYYRPSERNMAIHCAMNYLWLTPWKLTGLSLNRGSLVKAYESQDFGAFIVALLLNVNVAFEATPISPEKKSDGSIQTKHATCGAHDDVKFTAVKCRGRALLKELFSVALRIISKILLQLFFGYLYKMQEKDSLVLGMNIAWYFYITVSGLQDLSQFFSLLLLNIKLEENFNHPYLSDSFSDFWSRRWNLVMGAQLRDLCYEPVVQGQWIAPRCYFEKSDAPMSRRIIGTFFTFFASAVVHVVCLAEMFHNREIQWDYSLCFIISPFVIIFEILLRAYTKSSDSMKKVAGKVPRFVRIIFVALCMLVLGHYTFFPPMQRARVFDKTIDSLFEAFKIQSPNGGVNFQRLEL